MKRTIAIGLVAILLCTTVGCSQNKPKTETGTVTLKVWGAQEDQALLQRMVDGFKAANPDKNYQISFGVVGENDAKTRVLDDPAAAADIFSFASDQITDLQRAGTLYEITRNRTAIIDANSAGSVEAAMVGDKLYAYPMTADNGYFLYYDAAVLTADDVRTMDGLLSAAGQAGKKVLMAVDDGWYTASFFLGAGCTIGIDTDGNQTCDFNNETGVRVGEAIQKLTADPAFIAGDNSVLTGGMGTTICAGVSGTWNAEALKEALGGRYAATKLPTFTVGGEQKQMGSFAGYKLLGINARTAYPLEAMALAEWLTNEENQLLRFRERAMGPSNRNAALTSEVASNQALAALAAQSQYATSQKDVLGGFWDPMKAFGTAMVSKDYSRSVKEQLDAMVAQIVAG